MISQNNTCGHVTSSRDQDHHHAHHQYKTLKNKLQEELQKRSRVSFLFLYLQRVAYLVSHVKKDVARFAKYCFYINSQFISEKAKCKELELYRNGGCYR